MRATVQTTELAALLSLTFDAYSPSMRLELKLTLQAKVELQEKYFYNADEMLFGPQQEENQERLPSSRAA